MTRVWRGVLSHPENGTGGATAASWKRAFPRGAKCRGGSLYAASMASFQRAMDLRPAERLAELAATLRMFGARGWTYAFAGGVATLLVIGAVTALFDNPIFSRQLEARPQDYVIWVLTGLLGGLILGTFAVSSDSANQGKAATGGFLATLAVGCPICNKVAVLLLGTSGALNFFGPSQMFIGIGSLVLLAWTLLLRAQSVAGACPVEAPAANQPARPTVL